MLSFEEFFHKKKIDLTALQAGEPALYAEFSKHYAAMGEKSFDHSKKFWFNKLRKTYLLAAGEPAPVPEKPLAISDAPLEPVSDVMPAEPSTTAVKPAGFKPRFKAGAAKAASTKSEKPKDTAPIENKTESTPATPEKLATEEPAAPITKPAGFKPRFKAGATKTVSTEQTKSEEAISVENKETPAPEEKPATEEPAAPITKPAGFKPRFKAGATKTVSSDQTKPEETISAESGSESTPAPEEKPVAEESAAPVSKPAGFKPRFKAGATKTVSTEQTKPEETISAENKETPAPEEKPVAEESAAPITKSAGFKPRFKAGATKPVSTEQPKPEETISVQNKETPAPEEKPVAEESAAPITKPAGFKPRFKAGATKTVSSDQTKPEETISAENKETAAPEEKPVAEESAAPTSKPTGFKPRFKAGVTKPSKPKEDQ